MNLRVKNNVMILLYLYALPALAVENGRMMSYIEQYKYLAIQEMHRSQIPASIKLAQAILESQAGTSLLATKANNHFGIKCGDSWSGNTYYLKDDDYDRNGNHIQSCFRMYEDASQSFMAHSDFISGRGRVNNRYAVLFSLAKDNYKGWAEGLQKLGYATHPLYAKRLINIIEDYQLYTLDEKELTPAPIVPAGFFLEKTTSPFTKVNGLKSVFVNYAVSPAEIAVDFGIPVDQIMKYNEFLKDENDAIKTPMNIYLEKKKRKNKDAPEYHVMGQGQTIESISQMYGIQTKALYRRNRLEVGSQPAVGSRIFLKQKVKFAPPLAKLIAVESASNEVETPFAPNTPIEPNDHIKTTQSVRTPLEQNLESIKKQDQPMTEPQFYTVSEKETLFSIARKFNTTVSELKALNQLTQDAIKIGQELRVK